MASILIRQYIDCVMDNLPKRPSLSRDNLKVANAIIGILKQCDSDEIVIEENEEITNVEFEETDHDWSADDEVCRAPMPGSDPTGPGLVQFGEKFVTVKEVEDAVAFYGKYDSSYRNHGKNRPPLGTMQTKFHFIKNKKHLEKLRNFESAGKIKTTRSNDLKFIAKELAKVVNDEMDNGSVLHDDDLLSMIATIIRKNKMSIEFVASKSWLNGWKRAHRISSRHVTKFVAKKRFLSRDELQKKADEFVKNSVAEMPNYNRSSIFNMDQSGFQLQMMTKRTLARTGSKKVECIVQSVEATTHSYTVLPLLCADGTFFPILFVNLQERNGKFPDKGHFQAKNLKVTCGSSYIMTKNHMKEHFGDVVFSDDMPDDILVMVDSWPPYRDSDAIESVRPGHKKLKMLTIPPGCTGFIQPLDVGVFGSFKKVIKKVSSYGQRTVPTFKINQRDNILMVLSLVFWQLCSPKLKNWLLYAWHAAGYDTPHPPAFKTPSELLFPRDVASHDCGIQNCADVTFIKCIYCDQFFCFSHFVIEYHQCV